MKKLVQDCTVGYAYLSCHHLPLAVPAAEMGFTPRAWTAALPLFWSTMLPVKHGPYNQMATEWGVELLSVTSASRRSSSVRPTQVENTDLISAEPKGSCGTYAATEGTRKALPIFHILVQGSTLLFTCRHKESAFLLCKDNLKCYFCIRKLRGSYILPGWECFSASEPIKILWHERFS